MGTRKVLILFLLGLCLPAPFALGQEAGGEAPAAPAAPAAPDFSALAKDPKLSTGDLKLYLRPLRKDQIEDVAKFWMDQLTAKVGEVSVIEAEFDSASGDKKAEGSLRLTALRGERNDIIDRLTAVLGAWKDKGGDPAEYEKYIEAVSGTSVNLTDAAGTYHLVKDWITSPSGGIKTGMNIIFFFLTLIAFKILAAILGGITRRAVGTLRKTSDLLRHFFVNTVRNVTFFIGLVVALSTIGINVGPFVAAIGAIGFIIGFALQGTLANFAAGIMILLYRPYDVGQVVTVSGVTGKVDAMSLVSTTLLTPDNQTVTIPNGSIWGGIITNITGNPTRRVDMQFGIGYEDDMAKAQGILEDIVANHPLVLKDPAPVIMLSELADSSVNFVVRPWSKTADYWTVKFEITRQVKERFDAEGVSIPFPQRDVHIHQAG